ncbi:hypothetical protein PRUPE_3G181700 [Prunus persica]|uniref:1-phosphatidylinositol-4-phosphate 5-kinase n=1 Tax=Prunus persica TaxID=3760 RepID=A0A251Q220_PRUPE|nr:phosphatidylinositol 4-phosphate 5-kinase 1-like isoform X2 [Prunus persica]ONI17833.1 hypothetical protein PRUPE_3G181700 [Prunus persica]
MGLEGAWRRGLFPGFVFGSTMGRLQCSTEMAKVSIEMGLASSGEVPVVFLGSPRSLARPYQRGKNYDLMLNLQLGIRYSIGKHASIVRDLKPSDFNPKEKFWTRFPPEGSNKTPPHQSFEFRWKDYCPMVFRHSFTV